MSVLGFVLLALAVLVVLAALWPQVAAKLGSEGRARRGRARRKRSFTVVDGDADDFVESVARDLEQLPVIEERDDRSRR